MYQELRLFISTQKVEAINETVKVVIDGVGYWIRLKEAPSHFEMLSEQATKNIMADLAASSDYTNEDSPVSSEDESDHEMNTSQGDDKGEESLYQSEDTHISINLNNLQQVEEVGGMRVEKSTTNCSSDEQNAISEGQGLDSGGNFQNSGSILESNQTMNEVWEPRDAVVTSLSNETSQVSHQEIGFDSSLEEEENNACMVTPHKKDELICEKVVALNIGKRPGRPRKKQKRFSFPELKSSKKRKLCKASSRAIKDKLCREGLDDMVKIGQKDLATEIYELGMFMVLIPVQKKDKSVKKLLGTTNNSQ